MRPRPAAAYALLLVATSCLPAGRAAAQSESRVTTSFQLGGTTGYGGYDYFDRESSNLSAGINIEARRFAGGQLLLGAGYSKDISTGDLSAVCRGGVRRTCEVGYPDFRLITADIGLRYQVKWLGEIDLLLQPTAYTARNEARWMFGPSSTVALSHRLWKSSALVVSRSGSYIASYQGQRLGLVNTSVGMRLW